MVYSRRQCFPWHHCKGFLWANGSSPPPPFWLYIMTPVCCLWDAVTLTLMRCSADRMLYCDSAQTVMQYVNVVRLECGQAVMKAELHCMAVSLQGRGQEAAPISVEQAQLMFYLWSFYILEQFCYLGNVSPTSPPWRDSLFCSLQHLWCHLLDHTVIFMISNVVNSLLDVTALLSCLLSLFALMGPRCNYQHVHLNRFHSALIKPGVCCDPCLRAMLVNLPRVHAFLL